MDGPIGRKKKAFGSLFSASVSGQVGEEKLAGQLGRSPPLLPIQKPSPHLSTGESVLVLQLEPLCCVTLAFGVPDVYWPRQTWDPN